MSDINFYQATVVSVGQPRSSKFGGGHVVALNVRWTNGATASIWCGPDSGNEMERREFAFATACQPGQEVTIKSRPNTKKPGATVETVVPPEEFQAAPPDDYAQAPYVAASPPAYPQQPQSQGEYPPPPTYPTQQYPPPPPAAPLPQPQPVTQPPAQSPTQPPVQPVTNGGEYNPLTPEHMVMFLSSLRDSERMWRMAYGVVNGMLADIGLEVSPDKTAEITTTFLLERPLWRLEKMEYPGGERQPMEPEQLVHAIGVKMSRVGDGEKPTKQMLTALRAGLSRITDTDEERHKLCAALTGVESTTKMTTRQVKPLLDWMNTNPERNYEVSATATIEAQRVLGQF